MIEKLKFNNFALTEIELILKEKINEIIEKLKELKENKQLENINIDDIAIFEKKEITEIMYLNALKEIKQKDIDIDMLLTENTYLKDMNNKLMYDKEKNEKEYPCLEEDDIDDFMYGG